MLSAAVMQQGLSKNYCSDKMVDTKTFTASVLYLGEASPKVVEKLKKFLVS